MKKSRVIAFIGLLVCALSFTGISKQYADGGNANVAAYFVCDLLPPDTPGEISAAAVAGGGAVGEAVGGYAGMALGCLGGPVTGALGYCVGRAVGRFAGML